MKCKTSLAMLGTGLLVIAMTTLLAVSSAKAAGRYKTLHKFTTGGQDGVGPGGVLIFDGQGNIYGTTGGGGSADDGGTVFELTPNQTGGWTESVLYSFCRLSGCGDGAGLHGGLIFDQAGNLYGTTYSGGALDLGAVFKLTPNQNGGWTESVVHSFCSLTNCADGEYPQAGLIVDQAGNFYGTTLRGGAQQAGAVFKLTPNQNGGWTESVLYSFCSLKNCADGWQPEAGLIFDQAGNLYGTTFTGGAHGTNGSGTVFQLTPNHSGGWTEHVLYSFCSLTNCADGQYPLASLIFDQTGNLYGTTDNGGAHGLGTVFQLTPNHNGGWTEHVLYSFCSLTNCADGQLPLASLIFDQAGNLYGTTAFGGTLHFGVVFKMAPKAGGGWSYQKLHNFADKPGAYPLAGLMLNTAGNLYGTTSGDAKKTFGSVFEITP